MIINVIRVVMYLNLVDFKPDKTSKLLALTWIRFNVMLFSMGPRLMCEDCLAAGVARGSICTYRKW